LAVFFGLVSRFKNSSTHQVTEIRHTYSLHIFKANINTPLNNRKNVYDSKGYGVPYNALY